MIFGIIVIMVSCFVLGYVGRIIVEQNKPEPDRAALECASLSAHTGTSVSQIKKVNLNGVHKVTAFFSFELEPGTIRETYVVVESDTTCNYEFTSLLIKAVIKAAKG